MKMAATAVETCWWVPRE